MYLIQPQRGNPNRENPYSHQKIQFKKCMIRYYRQFLCYTYIDTSLDLPYSSDEDPFM